MLHRGVAVALAGIAVTLVACGGGTDEGTGPDLQVPNVALTAPTPGATVQGNVTVSATATDNDAIAGVQFRLDGNPLGIQDTEAPYQVTWETDQLSDGAYTLTAVGSDDAGNTAVSPPVLVTVANAPAPTPTPGVIDVTVATTGPGADSDGYLLRIDAIDRGAIAGNGILSVSGLTVGNHLVQLTGVSPFCTVAGSSSQSVSVNAGAASAARFDVTCATSPSGRIAFEGVPQAGRCCEIRIINADGGGQRVLASEASEPAWSPDGTRLAFVGSNGPGTVELFIVNADGTGLTSLASMTQIMGSPNWSPDGQRIVFHSFRPVADVLDLYIVNQDGSGLRPVFATAANRQTPDWSPDGTRLVFAMPTPEDLALLWTATPDGTELAQLTSGNRDFSPSWSPDGSRIAFRRQSVPAYQQTEIYVVNADGTNPVNLTNHPAFDFSPDWSPDGQWLTFWRDGGGVWIMRADGTEAIMIAPDGGEPAWGP